MSNTDWTKLDEAMLNELQERKAAFELARIRPVIEMVCKVHPKITDYGAVIQEIADRMIEHADMIRDALAPFDSGVRQAKVQ